MLIIVRDISNLLYLWTDLILVLWPLTGPPLTRKLQPWQWTNIYFGGFFTFSWRIFLLYEWVKGFEWNICVYLYSDWKSGFLLTGPSDCVRPCIALLSQAKS